VAIVCTDSEKTNGSLYRLALVGLLLWILLPVGAAAAPAPSALQCDTGLSGYQANVGFTENQQLNFGAFIGGLAGTITIDYKGSISSTGPTLLASIAPLPGIVTFSTDWPTGAGPNCSNVTPATVSFTDGYLTDSTGTYSMRLTNFTFSTKSGNPFTKFNTGTYYIGADLIVSGSEGSGSYSTSNPGGTPYQITISFQ